MCCLRYTIDAICLEFTKSRLKFSSHVHRYVVGLAWMQALSKMAAWSSAENIDININVYGREAILLRFNNVCRPMKMHKNEHWSQFSLESSCRSECEMQSLYWWRVWISLQPKPYLTRPANQHINIFHALKLKSMACRHEGLQTWPACTVVTIFWSPYKTELIYGAHVYNWEHVIMYETNAIRECMQLMFVLCSWHAFRIAIGCC